MTERDLLWAHLRDLPYFRAMLRAVEASFYQEYELPRPMLDVGCGDGHFATLAFKQRAEVGVDPSGSLIRQAARLGGYQFLVQADGGQLPFPDRYFSSAVSNSVLEHIVHIHQVLKETARVLKPGSPFLFSVPNRAYLGELSIPIWLRRVGLHRLGEAYANWFRRMSRVVHLEEAETWQDWLEVAGFRLERHWRYFSPQAMRMLEWGHYFGAPTLLPHALTGRWILMPTRWNLALTELLVRPYVVPAPHPDGVFTFYVARKTS